MKKLILLFLFILSSCVNITANKSRLLPSEKEGAIQVLISKAATFLREDDLEGAYSALSLAEEINPKHSGVSDGLGLIAYKKGDLPLAIKYFQLAIKNNQNNESSYSHLGIIAKQKGDLKAAEDLQTMALKINPTYVPARVRLAELFEMTGRNNQAHFEKLRAVLMKN